VRAGFCLMGACQDCWVWTADGQRVRACTTVVSKDLDIVTRQPELQWPNLV
jgi:aerobic-type carbon monoxide dehydrogenase small subunit (CoxS/CutS family)